MDHSFATAWDEGLMLGSRRAWWRIAAQLEEQMLRPQVPTRKQNRRTRGEKPVLKATGPGQIWSWDITDLYSPYKNCVFKAYSIIDIFSRQIVGYRVEEREADHMAVEMFEQAFKDYDVPQVVHADSGPAMKSNALKNALEARHVRLSHNRPNVSNDNPFSESGFRTMKYRPGYPKVFVSVEDARAYLNGYVPWYNCETCSSWSGTGWQDGYQPLRLIDVTHGTTDPKVSSYGLVRLSSVERPVPVRPTSVA